MIDALLEYSKVPVTIQSYYKAQSYSKATVDPSDQKDTRYARRCTDDDAATAITSEDVPGLNTNPDGTFKLYENLYPLKAFVPEKIYLGRLPKSFRDVRREKKTDQSTKLGKTSNTNNWQEKVHDRKSLKSATTKTNPKAEDTDDTSLLFIDLIFTVAAFPTMAQACSSSADMCIDVPEDPNIKVIFTTASACIQVSYAAAPRSMDTITVEVTKSQVDILAKKGATIVNQGGDYYSIVAMTLSNLAPNQCRYSVVYTNNLNW